MMTMKTLNYSLLFFHILRYNYLGDTMKKILLLIIPILILTSCTKEKETSTNIPNIDINETPTVKEYKDDNPIKVALYQNGKKVTTYKTVRQNWTDLGVFEVCFSDKDNLESESTKYNFKKYYETYENIDKYKIGFQLEFETTDDKSIDLRILAPTEMYGASPYMYNYLYDDIHEEDGAWYSHLTAEDIKDNTILSSIKLFYAEKSEAIKLPIKLTAFTYDSDDDFDEYKHYRGNSKYTITIE